MQVVENEIYRKIGGSKNLPNFHFLNKSENGKEIKQKSGLSIADGSPKKTIQNLW